jgi:hypothetical protein
MQRAIEALFLGTGIVSLVGISLSALVVRVLVG